MDLFNPKTSEELLRSISQNAPHAHASSGPHGGLHGLPHTERLHTRRAEGLHNALNDYTARAREEAVRASEAEKRATLTQSYMEIKDNTITLGTAQAELHIALEKFLYPDGQQLDEARYAHIVSEILQDDFELTPLDAKHGVRSKNYLISTMVILASEDVSIYEQFTKYMPRNEKDTLDRLYSARFDRISQEQANVDAIQAVLKKPPIEIKPGDLTRPARTRTRAEAIADNAQWHAADIVQAAVPQEGESLGDAVLRHVDRATERLKQSKGGYDHDSWAEATRYSLTKNPETSR